MKTNASLNRRNFLSILGAGGIGMTIPSKLYSNEGEPVIKQEKPATNIEDALKYPRNDMSMPGKFPGSVVRINHLNSIKENEPDEDAAYKMLEIGLRTLTGQDSAAKAIRMFIGPGDKTGLKVNPVAGKSLSTSHAVVKALIRHLVESGIPKENLVIWDRREFQLTECGFTPEQYPGIRITGTERQDENGSFYSSGGALYSEELIDKQWYYWADVDGEYDEYTLPYMVNGGKYSYFSKLCTSGLDKIINIPVLKNAGSSVTLALKNLAYGAITNTGRLHKDLWAETCAQVCAFPPLRDKVVLNIVDGIRGCFNGGPAANPQFFTDYKLILLGTDPVAVDRIGYEIVINKRIREGIQESDVPKGRIFMDLANQLGLGESELSKIKLQEHELS